ncbi:hypothetical protein [Vibrio coralliirubri]|uniref:hypothetical protein n=1 Tax=Vibrio coralliirubri TaxID=1516159 RepID=UPI00069A137F|nr:hypothetical protein [Vibrio coralliirubri]
MTVINLFIWLCILCILSIGYVFEYRKKEKELRFPFLTFTILMFYHEFIFINLSYYFQIENIVLSSSWKEIILISFSFFIFFGGRIGGINKIAFYILIMSVFFVTFGIISSLLFTHSSFGESVLIGKRYIFPFLFLCSLSLIPDTGIDIKKSCNIFFYFVIFPNFIFGIWEVLTVKSLDELWFYEPLVFYGNNFESFNHFRDGIVRANGFFVGTLTYAATAFFSCICFFILRKEKLSYLKFFVSLSMLLLSQTRTFFIGLIFFFFLYILSKSIFNKKIKVSNVLLIILLSVISIISLLPYITQEFSAVGRIYQWINALELIKSNPLGQGFSSIGLNGDNRADSQIIDLMRIYGFLIIPLFIGFLSLIVFYWNRIRLFSQRSYTEVPFFAIVSYIFVLFFQSLVDAAVFYFIFLLLFKLRVYRRVSYA